jgi:DNA-binding response OmpR family regulator
MPAVSTAPLPPMARPVGVQPVRTKVLFVTTAQRVGGWLAEALSAEGLCELRLEEVAGAVGGLSRLRDEIFDAVLVSHVPGELDALAFLHAVRTGGSEEPVIVLGLQSEQELSAAAFEAGADAYVCVNTVTSRTLNHLATRAVQRHRLLRENRRLTQAERQRLDREHAEARHLLDELGSIAADLERLRMSAAGTGRSHAMPEGPLPPELFAHYRELLRAHVIMGSGNLAEEVYSLAELLTSAGIGARQALELHLGVLEESIAGLGNRSGRHVMTRANLLLLELVSHLAEGCRQRYGERKSPPQQKHLPGFERVPAAIQQE